MKFTELLRQGKCTALHALLFPALLLLFFLTLSLAHSDSHSQDSCSIMHEQLVGKPQMLNFMLGGLHSRLDLD